MSLDERVRTGLTRSAATSTLDVDAMLDDVVASHGRGRVRSRVVRQATAVAVALTLFVGVAVLVSWRNAPVRYWSAATLDLGTANSAQTAGVSIRLDNAVRLALAPATRRATLLAAHLPADDPDVAFHANAIGAHGLLLQATADTREVSAAVTDEWAARLALIRRQNARVQLIEARRNVARRVTALLRNLETVDLKLARALPSIYGSVWKYDGPTVGKRPTAPPPVPERATPTVLNLAFERIQLKSRIEKLGGASASSSFAALTPNVITKRLDQHAPARVDTTPSPLAPLIGWGAGIGLIVAAAYVVYRRRSTRVHPTQFRV